MNDDQSALADAEVTLSFQDGPPNVAGSGGCNSYTGSFSLDEVNLFVITVGPLAATEKSCPDPIGSQESAYFAALENASHWGYVFGKLALYDAGGQDVESRLLFAPQAAPETAALTTTELVPPPTEDLTMLRAHPWQWVSFTNSLEALEIEDPANYRVSFNPDASLAITAGCNDVVGFYQGESGDALTITVDPATLSECGPASCSAQFITLLGSGVGYFFEDGNLYIDLMADGGTMGFAPAGWPDKYHNEYGQRMAEFRSEFRYSLSAFVVICVWPCWPTAASGRMPATSGRPLLQRRWSSRVWRRARGSGRYEALRISVGRRQTLLDRGYQVPL